MRYAALCENQIFGLQIVNSLIAVESVKRTQKLDRCYERNCIRQTVTLDETSPPHGRHARVPQLFGPYLGTLAGAFLGVS